MLIDIFASRRPDFKVMVNGVLTKIGAMGDNFVSVKPDSSNQGANLKNINGVRMSLQQLKEGHPMGFFLPALFLCMTSVRKNTGFALDAQRDSSDPESESSCISRLFRFPKFRLFLLVGADRLAYSNLAHTG